MVRTCHFCNGHSDNYNEANLKRCSGCQKVFYCSAECQKYDWVRHIFDCNPRRPINTADYLALAVHENLLPEHPQTCEDYGFDRLMTGEDKSKLLGLYIGLIERMDTPPKTIHRWRVDGVLADEIKSAFGKIPEGSRGGYFAWFLKNEHVISGKPLPDETLRNYGDTAVVRAWRFTGGSERDSAEDVRAAMARKPSHEQDCHWLYVMLLEKWHPAPEFDLWIRFGFAACTSQEEEMELGGQYQKLITKCSFKEFCDAYQNAGLLNLFHSKGLRLYANRYPEDILTGPGWYKSVWYLKQLIQDRVDEKTAMRPSVAVDYGFVNCRDDSERRQLKRVYKAFFGTHRGDPLALHEAAIKGNTHGFLSEIVKGLRDPKFQRLMRNPYPLHDL